MAQVMLDIGGRPHAVACRDGEESRVRLLGAMLAERWGFCDAAYLGRAFREVYGVTPGDYRAQHAG